MNTLRNVVKDAQSESLVQDQTGPAYFSINPSAYIWDKQIVDGYTRNIQCAQNSTTDYTTIAHIISASCVFCCIDNAISPADSTISPEDCQRFGCGILY